MGRTDVCRRTCGPTGGWPTAMATASLMFVILIAMESNDDDNDGLPDECDQTETVGLHSLDLWPSWPTPRPGSQKFQRPMAYLRQLWVMCFDCKEPERVPGTNAMLSMALVLERRDSQKMSIDLDATTTAFQDNFRATISPVFKTNQVGTPLTTTTTLVRIPSGRRRRH